MLAEEEDTQWMRYALSLARLAQRQGEVPVGAVLVKNQKLLACSHNAPIASQDPTAHAEVLAIRKAGKKIANYRLLDTTLYVTLEPCVMCVGAIVHARISRVVFGAYDPKRGGVCSAFSLFEHPALNHHPAIKTGVLANECGKLLTDFFCMRRRQLTE